MICCWPYLSSCLVGCSVCVLLIRKDYTKPARHIVWKFDMVEALATYANETAVVALGSTIRTIPLPRQGAPYAIGARHR